MTTVSELPIAEGRGSVSGAPNLPDGFADTFTSRYVDTGEVRLHAVIGGDGPPVLLIHGWPGSWYNWAHEVDRFLHLFPPGFVFGADLRA